MVKKISMIRIGGETCVSPASENPFCWEYNKNELITRKKTVKNTWVNFVVLWFGFVFVFNIYINGNDGVETIRKGVKLLRG